VPQSPQERGFPVQAGGSSPPPEPDANTESFFNSFVEPQCGQGVPFQSVERTSSSLSRLHVAQ